MKATLTGSVAGGLEVGRGPDGFFWSSAPEPHAARRRELLGRYPEVTALYGPCWKTKYYCVAGAGIHYDRSLHGECNDG